MTEPTREFKKTAASSRFHIARMVQRFRAVLHALRPLPLFSSNQFSWLIFIIPRQNLPYLTENIQSETNSQQNFFCSCDNLTLHALNVVIQLGQIIFARPISRSSVAHYLPPFYLPTAYVHNISAVSLFASLCPSVQRNIAFSDYFVILYSVTARNQLHNATAPNMLSKWESATIMTLKCTHI